MQRNEEVKKSLIKDYFSFVSFIKGIVISYFITIPLFIIFAYLLTYTSFPEKYISTVVLITTIISILFAGSTTTRNIRNRGWLNGAFVGLVYIVILYILSSLAFKDFSINRQIISMTFIGILTGAIGGIIGINAKNVYKKKYKKISFKKSATKA